MRNDYCYFNSDMLLYEVIKLMGSSVYF